MTRAQRDSVLNYLFYFAMLGLLLAASGGVLALFANTHLAAEIGLSGVLLFTLAFILADFIDKGM